MELPVTDLPLVRCESLSIGYRTPDGNLARVVADASFQIWPGEAIGIVGESGSGKSTLARALLGYRRAGSKFLGGSLHFRDHCLTTAEPAAIRRLRGVSIAMVPQNPLSSLTFHLPVGRQVIEVLQTRSGVGRKEARSRAIELLTRTGLPTPEAIMGRYPHQLSGGQRQRVVIAAALACDPQLLVLDEPTTALDKTTEVQVLRLIADLRKASGTALVLVTHDLNVVSRVCERLLVMHEGKIVEEGPVEHVFRRPRNAYTRQLLASALVLDVEERRVAAPLPGAPLLDVEGVAFSYTRHSWIRASGPPPAMVLNSVSVQVRQREVLGIIGESGSGKTTLGLIAAGLLSAQAGQLRLDGQKLSPLVSGRTPEQLRRIQMIFQDPLSSLNPRQSVGEALSRPYRHFFRMDRHTARERAIALLAKLGLGPEYLDRFPRQLSGGQQQRVAIARAFAAEPDLLICDEITSALDASIQAQVLEQLIQLQRDSGAAMIVITHDLSVIWKVATRVIVIKAGRIVEEGETASVFSSPKSRYTSELLDSATQARRFLATA